MQTKPAVELLKKYHVHHPSDTAFASNARLLQSVWREEKGYPFEEYGNRLPIDFAKTTKANYLTKEIGELVENEVTNSGDRVFGEPRIWNNLLSSQPLVFNLFGELKLEEELKTATAIFSELFPGKVDQVTGIEFEFSPSRRDPKYTNDRSAFDVFVEYSSSGSEKCFWGIEVKYSEALNDTPARVREEYDRISDAMGIFKPDKLDELKNTSIQQLWRDHLLVGSMFITNPDYDHGDFIVLYPEGNEQCQRAIERYQHTFNSDENYLIPLTIERFYEALSNSNNAGWVQAFYDRYLNFAKLKEL